MYTRCDNAAFANFVAAISRTNSNWFEFVRLIAATMIFMKLTVSHKAICCGDLSPRRVAATYRLVCPWQFHVVVLLTTANKWTTVKNTRAGRAKLLFLPTKYSNLGRSRCRRRYRCLSSLVLGSLRNHDGYGDENVTSKYKFELF